MPPRKLPRSALASRPRVFEAADAILASGVRPTYPSVRERLGGGSPNSINAYLQEWYGDLGRRLTASEQPLAGLPPAVMAAFTTIWRTAQQEAASGEAGDRSESIAEATLSALRAEKSALESVARELRTQRSKLETQLAEARAVLAHRDAELTELRSSLSEMQTQMIRFAQEATTLRAELGAVRAHKAVVVRALRPPRRSAVLKKRSAAGRRKKPSKSRGTQERNKRKILRKQGRR